MAVALVCRAGRGAMSMKALLAATVLCFALLTVAPSGSAAAPPGPDVECMDMYRETHLVGAYWLVQRSSCSAQVYECPPGYDPPAPPCREAVVSTMALGPPDLNEWPKCVPIAVGRLCTSIYWPGCNLWIEWTAIPAQPTCLYRTDGLAMSAASPAPAYEPNCLYYYYEVAVGPVRHVQRDSCNNEQYICDNDASHGQDETARAYIASQLADPDPSALAHCTVESLGLVTTSDPPELQRTCFRQGQGELQTVTCIDPNSTDCTIYRQQITGMGSSWVCYPSGESGSDF